MVVGFVVVSALCGNANAVFRGGDVQMGVRIYARRGCVVEAGLDIVGHPDEFAELAAEAQAEDIRAAALQAVETVKQENGYLFESRQIPKFAQGTGRAAPGGSSEPTTLAGALRARMKR